MNVSVQSSPKVWVILALIVLSVPVAVLLFYIQNQGGITDSAPIDPSCDLNKTTCQSQFSDGSRVSLSITPSPIIGLTPLQIQVETHGIEADSVEVDFSGVGMNMGYHRPVLKQVMPGRYTGTWVLAVCTLERMSWEATVLIDTKDGTRAAPFRFDVIRPQSVK